MLERDLGGGGAWGQLPPALLTRREEKVEVLLLAFHWDSSEVKRLLCSIVKVSVVSVSLPFSAVIPALVGLNSSFDDS